MVLRYSEETTEVIFSSKEFLNCFEENYSNKNKEQLISFLNNIETNKKYYKMGIQKNKRFKRVENDDTVCIKKINSLINKLTNDTCENIIKVIIPLLKPQILSYININIPNINNIISLYPKPLHINKGANTITAKSLPG